MTEALRPVPRPRGSIMFFHSHIFAAESLEIF
jgi:hypothetical protein